MYYYCTLGASGQSSNGLIYKIIAQDPSLLLDPEVQDVIRQFTGFGGQTGMDPYELADVLKASVIHVYKYIFVNVANGKYKLNYASVLVRVTVILFY